ncbi:MAG TPA: response regulator [Candidatus Binatia bacterium]|nr:response regulator [Candidatus Binatia bacterium]
MPDQNKSLVVVVEDDAGMRKALERLLRVAGYQTALFSSAEAFLDSTETDLAACLVLDIHLPGLSGLELQRRLAASGRHSPAIFITAQDDEAARDEARQLKCSAYFRKPFEGAALLAAIQRALNAFP